MISRIPPKARLAATIIAIIATFIANEWIPLLIALILLVILLTWTGILKAYLRFALTVLFPISAMLLLVWGVVTRAPPNMPVGSSPKAGIAYAIVVAFRLAVVCGLLQLSLLSVPSRLLPAMLRGWGLHGDSLAVALGVFAVGPELSLRANQVITARRARGLLRGNIFAIVCEFPHLIRPLFVWSIRAAVQRSEAWQQRALLARISYLPSDSTEFSFISGLVALIISFGWLTVAILCRWFVLLPHLGDIP